MKFSYQATNQIGEIIKGELDAPNKEYVFNWLVKKELTPIDIKLAETGRKGLGMKIAISKISDIDRILLVKRLAAVLKAGIPIIEGLDILIKDTKKPYLKKILLDVKSIMERGESLASAFASFPRDFSPVFVGLVRAGENSGTLDQTLETIALNLRKESDLKRSIRSAMTYPIILLLVASAILTILVTFVLPRITVAFEQSGLELPFITKVILGISKFISQSPILTILIIFGLLALGGFLTFLSPKGIRKITDRAMLKTPVISGLIHNLALARFSGILSNLLASGLPAIEALEITGQSMGNETYKDEILKARESVKRGVAIGEALEKRTDLFPHILLSMIAVGEKTGTLDEVLKTLADFYEAETDRLIKTILSLLEPVLLLIMGGLVALVALSIILPIYKMVSGFA